MNPIKSPRHPDLLARIADRGDTPVYVYFEEVIRRQIQTLKHVMKGVPGRLLYAMKANSHPAVMSVMADAGLGIDAVSPAELLLALRMGIPADRILYSANNMTDGEMRFAQSQGVLLNIGELSRLARFGAAFPGSDVCVRLNPEVGAGHHDHVITAGSKSKFGVPVAQIDALRTVLQNHDLNLVGLHQHIGSGIPDPETLWTAVEVLLEASAEFPGVRFLNLGGGLGVPYRPGERGFEPDSMRAHLQAPLKRFAEKRGVEVWFEPGRFLVAESGVLVTRVTTVKDNGDRVFVGTDTGMNHLIRPALYGSYHAIYNLSNPDGPLRTYDIVGNICETGDTFARDRQVQEIREDDLLAILDAGAYGMAMVSEYNLRAQPEEVWVREAESGRWETITERLRPAEVVAQVLDRSRVPDRGA